MELLACVNTPLGGNFSRRSSCSWEYLGFFTHQWNGTSQDPGPTYDNGAKSSRPPAELRGLRRV